MSIYDPAFVEFQPILSNEDRALLRGLAARYPLSRFQREPRNYEEMRIDFVHTSAKIEGNTYDRIETDALLRFGVTAGGKRYSDAVMLVNLRDSFERAMLVESGTTIDRDYVCDLHKIAMRDLLPASQTGIVRSNPVAVGGTEYHPLDDPRRIRAEFDAIMETAGKYADPFERGIYLHCNLAYLQPFQDGNKRTARMMQTVALVQGGVLPVFPGEAQVTQYIGATINYYDTGKYDRYVEFFRDAYRRGVERIAGPERGDRSQALRAAKPVAYRETGRATRRARGKDDLER